MLTTALVIAVVLAIFSIAGAAAYQSGALDRVIEQVGIYLFKAKAKAEEKKLQAQGLKEGQDFFKSELKGTSRQTKSHQGWEASKNWGRAFKSM